MFFAGRGEPAPGEGYGPGDPPPPPPCSLWLSIILPNLFNFFTVFLNFLVFFIMARKCSCTFTSAQNMLFMTLMLVMVESGINSIVCSVLGEVMAYDPTIPGRINQISDMCVSYFSISIIFLIGLHRCCVYTQPRINSLIFTRKRLFVILAVLAVFCFLLALLVISKCGINKKMDDGLLFDYVADMSLFKTTNYIAYGIAISSTIFYVRIFFHLRRQRVNVVHDKTKELLCKAEMQNCHQGAFILIVYTISLVAFVISETVDVDDDVMWLLHCIQSIVNSLPMLAIPLSLFFWCPLMKEELRKIFLGGKRKGSAGSSSSTRKSVITVSF